MTTMNRRGWLRLSATALAALQPWWAGREAEAASARLGAQMTADGIPRFEAWLMGEREAPMMRFAGWHPVKPEMLVLTRRGARMQLHRLGGRGWVPEPLTQGRDAVGSAAWEPSRAEYLVFARDQGGNEAYQLFRLDAGGDERRPAPIALTPEGERVSEYTFLPEGQGLVYLQQRLDARAAVEPEDSDDPEKVEEREKTEEREDAQAVSAAGPGLTNLWWTDPMRPGERRLLGASEGRLGALRVSPAGRVMAALSRGGRTTGLVFPLDGSGPHVPGATGAHGAAARSQGPSGEDIVWRRQAVQGEFRHLVRGDAAGGRSRNELVDIGADLEGLAVPPRVNGNSNSNNSNNIGDRPLALVYNVDGVSSLRLYRPGGTPATIAQDLAPGVIRSPQWHPRLPLLGFEQVSAQSPGQLFVHSLEDGSTRAWTDAAEGPGQRTGVLRWKSFDGREITGLHLAPPPRFTGPRPVYVSLHGGPASQARPGYVAGLTRALLERLGMHVIEPNVRGSDGFGKSFLKLDDGRRREDATRDVSALLDLIATREDMDASRVVVAGGSYGGYLSLAVATRESARLAGSICRVGIANFVSFLERTESYRRDNRREEYGDERDPEMRAFLTSISPLTHAGAVRKPLMVIHGRNDPRVPFSEAQAMVAAVRAQGTPVWFLSADDEGHSFTKADNRAYANQASLEFVRRVIEGAALDR